MKSIRLLLLIFLPISFCISGFDVSAQKMPGLIKRFEIGYSIPVAWAEYSSKDATIDPKTGKTITNEIKQNVHSKLSYGGFFGTTVPVKRLGSMSMFAVGVNLMYNAYLWNYTVPSFTGYFYDSLGQITGFEYIDDGFGFSGASVQLAMPLTLDFKWGCDAICEKTIRFCGTVGGGALGSMAATVDASNAGYGIGVAPVIKGEFGVMAGVCFKLRALYSFGNIPYYAEGNSFYNLKEFSSTSSLTGKSSFTLSLVIMPMAFSWKNSGWWSPYR